MYPNLYFFLKDSFDIQPWNFTQYINSFGFFVALAFVLSAVLLTIELKRKEKQGLLQPKEETIKVGEPAGWSELTFNFLFGFVVGYKILGAFLNSSDVNPQQYIFSSEGSWVGGFALAFLFSGLKYWEKKKQVLPKPEERKIRVWPHERVGDIIIIGAIAGFLGAKKLFWGGFKDTKLEACRKLIIAIENILAKVKPDMVLVNYPDDAHQDHKALASCAVTACRYIKRVLLYQDYTTLDFLPDTFMDITDVLKKKNQLLACHKSQVQKEYPTGLDMLENVSARASYYGFAAKVNYAEGFKPLRNLISF